jgi:multiple sugar transport system ATP-binding protein
MAQVKVSNLIKKFGDIEVVRKVELSIKDGEFVFFLGPSGCGKTTTLRMIAGLLMPTSGLIEIGGRNVTFLKPQDRNVGMVFQQNVLYSHLSVFDNIAYPLVVRGFKGQELRNKVDDVANRLHIKDVLNRMPNELSGGQSQRVAIGRMLVRQADVFLMDEPISHLDAKLRAYMRTELRHLQKSLNVTTLFVSHDQLEAMSMADRIVVMNDGAIQQFATPQEIFDKPANKFVASFVGEPHMNIFKGNVGYELGQPCVIFNGGAIGIEGLPKELVFGSSVEVGVRPEHVMLNPLDTSKLNRGRVEAVEPMGAENLITVDIGGELIQSRMSAFKCDDLRLCEGASVSIGFPEDYIYLFDSNSGQTIRQANLANKNLRAAA